MLKIRLQRIGKRGQAYFRLVVTEHTVKPQGKYLELLGSYDPHKKALLAEGERIKYWLGQGAQLSPTANNLLITKGVIQGERVRAWKAKQRVEGEKAGETVKEIKTEEAAGVSEPKEEKPAEITEPAPTA